jgi:mRNA interferase HigB
MRIHLVKERTVREYVLVHAGAAASFEDWLKKLAKADWNTPMDILEVFRSADLLGKSSSRVVFDIGGNNHRVICKYVFAREKVWLYVCWIGTHAAYDKLCSQNDQYTVWAF